MLFSSSTFEQKSVFAASNSDVYTQTIWMGFTSSIFLPSSNLLQIDFSARDPSNFGSMQTASGQGGGMMLMMPSAILKSCLFSRCQVREFASNCWASEQTDGEVDVAQSQRVPWQMKFGPEISGPWVVG